MEFTTLYSIQNNEQGAHRRQSFTQPNLSLKKSFLIQSPLKLLLDESHHALANLDAGRKPFPEVEYILSPYILFSRYRPLQCKG